MDSSLLQRLMMRLVTVRSLHFELSQAVSRSSGLDLRDYARVLHEYVDSLSYLLSEESLKQAKATQLSSSHPADSVIPNPTPKSSISHQDKPIPSPLVRCSYKIGKYCEKYVPQDNGKMQIQSHLPYSSRANLCDDVFGARDVAEWLRGRERVSKCVRARSRCVGRCGGEEGRVLGECGWL